MFGGETEKGVSAREPRKISTQEMFDRIGIG
jgi:hypothetical protein